MMNRRTLMGTAAAALAAVGLSGAALAADAIKVGNTMAYSGPASAYGQIGTTIEKYIDMVNARAA